MSADVELRDVRVTFGSFVAVEGANVHIDGGEFFSFLGPSGCGKTTLLRTISGFQEPTSGQVQIDGRDMAGIGPNKRPTALIFQNLALFPLMTVWENIAFSLEVRGIGKAERRRRAEDLLDLIALPDQADKRIHELSGGQKQRVAVARALASEPKVLLLDEPLSALDLKLRQHMRTELRAIQKRVGITFIYITHDQGEALAMSDRVAVMNAGVIEQIADSTEIYDNPASAFVASFVGENNAMTGRVLESAGETLKVETPLGPMLARGQGRADDQVLVFVRPEAIALGAEAAGRANNYTAQVSGQEFEGSFWHLDLAAQGGQELRVSRVNGGPETAVSAEGEIAIGFDAAAAIALPPGPLAKE